MKNDSIDNIRLDINREKVRASVSVRYGDTKTRTLHCTLVDSGTVVDLSNALFAELLIRKPDGREADQNVVIYGNELQYTWRTQDVNALGENVCQIMVTFEDGAVITSPEFSLYVYSKVLNQRVQESMNEYTAITQQLVDAKRYADDSRREAESAGNSATEAAESSTAAQAAETHTLELHGEVQELKTQTSASETHTAELLAEVQELSEQVSASETHTLELHGEVQELSVQASASASSASASAANAQTYASSAEESNTSARGYADSASASATLAKEYEDSAEQSAISATASEEKAKEYLEQFGEGTLILGETSTTAYRGDRGKEAYDHSNVTGNPHGTTYQDVGADRSGAADAALVSANGYADQKMSESYQNATAYTDTAIANLINGAPSTLDTLKEIADAMAENDEVVTALDTAIGTKAGAEELQSHEGNNVIHITASERIKWNQVDLLMDMIGYPYTPS